MRSLHCDAVTGDWCLCFETPFSRDSWLRGPDNGFAGWAGDGSERPHVQTAVPLGRASHAVEHPSEYGSDSEEDDGELAHV